MGIKHICFRSDMSATTEYFFHDGTLFINDTLSTERKLEIIRSYMIRED